MLDFEIADNAVALAALPVEYSLFGRVVEGGHEQEVRVRELPFCVGRRGDNQLHLQDQTVSGRHAELVESSDPELGLEVHDLGSTNGTFVNGVRVDTTAPVAEGDLVQFGSVQFEVRQSSLSRTTFSATLSADVSRKAIAHSQFTKLIEHSEVNPHYQPIVDLREGAAIGYEILARSNLAGLESPASMFEVASERHMEAELSQVLRYCGVAQGRAIRNAALYVNTHPAELSKPGLIQSLRQLRDDFPEPNILLEIHESAITTPDFLGQLRPQLRELNIGLAYDDFGSGQNRLLELTQVPPDVIKFDISLVRNLPKGTWAYLQTIRSLVDIVKGLGVIPLAEGVETLEERKACLDVGFELAQGYFFGRPQPIATPKVSDTDNA